MHIVIIGGGAAGMISAHYLAQFHRVTLIEREPILGGNIRTLNGNVTTEQLPPDIVIDNGVIEFHLDHSPGLIEVLADLGLALEPVTGGSTSLFLEDGRSYHMPDAIRAQSPRFVKRWPRYLQLAMVLRHLVPIRRGMGKHISNMNSEVGDFLRDDPMSDWIRMLLMYAYSIPFANIDGFPARLAIPTLLQCTIGTRWARLSGGVYRYINAIMRQANPNLCVMTGQSVRGILRDETGVAVPLDDRLLRADKLVLAVTPDQVLTLLAEPDEQELRWFTPWQENIATTVIHTDTSIYSPWGQPGYTEFDVFEKSGGADAGYNAYLNHLCGLPGNIGDQYFLAYNLDDRIDPQAIVHRQRHRTPLYTVAAHRQVEAIKSANGSRNTYFAGAYLYNGLHEGAAQSALALRDLLCSEAVLTGRN